MTKKLVALALSLPLFGTGCFSNTPSTNINVIPPPPTPVSTDPLPTTSTPPLPSSTSTTVTDSAELKKDLIVVANLKAGQKIKSPFTVQGKARGNWYFEAFFPYELRDASGTLLAQGPVQASGDWMTTNFVPFSLVLTFPTPTTTSGTLTLKKDNPSGLPANDDQLVIPVQF